MRNNWNKPGTKSNLACKSVRIGSAMGTRLPLQSYSVFSTVVPIYSTVEYSCTKLESSSINTFSTALSRASAMFSTGAKRTLKARVENNLHFILNILLKKLLNLINYLLSYFSVDRFLLSHSDERSSSSTLLLIGGVYSFRGRPSSTSRPCNFQPLATERLLLRGITTVAARERSGRAAEETTKRII